MNEAASPPAAPAQSASGSYIAQASGGSTAIVADIVNLFQTAPARSITPAEIAAAQTLLAGLPLDTLPPPSGLPPGSHLPFPRNRAFVGREPDLQDLARQLKQGGTAAV